MRFAIADYVRCDERCWQCCTSSVHRPSFDICSPQRRFQRRESTWVVILHFSSNIMALVRTISPTGIVCQRDHFSSCRFPANSLKAQRALLAIQQYYPGKLVQVSRKFFTCYWQEKQNFETEGSQDYCFLSVGSFIVSLEEIKGVLTACGFSEAESAKVLGSLNDQAIKDKLRANTEEALAKGSFGAPTMIARRRTGEERLFFGQDRIQPMLFYLGLVPRARY